MTPEQIKTAAKESAEKWEGIYNPSPGSLPIVSATYDGYELGVEAGIKIGLEAKIQMEPLIIEREDTLSKAILISDELENEALELRGFKELATKQLRDMTEQLKALQSKCVAYEAELEKKDEEVRRFSHLLNNLPNQ